MAWIRSWLEVELGRKSMKRQWLVVLPGEKKDSF